MMSETEDSGAWPGDACRAGEAAAAFEVRAPGRVNLIGEHTDYNDGFVLPMAIDRAVVLTVRRRHDRLAVLCSERDATTATLDLDGPIAPGARGWTAYPAGVIAGCRELGWRVPGFEVVVSGDLPVGAGLSSSAALEVATATAIEALCGRSLPPVTKALLCQRAEHAYAGVPCGIMDQFAVTCGRAGQALLLDCRNREIRHVPLDGAVRVVVANSGVRHALADGEYALRRRQCASAAALLGVASLRDVPADTWRTQVAGLPDVERRRATHVISENARTLGFVAALSRGEWPRAGRLMRESHASLADDYEVSCREVDLLVSLAASLPGVHGCRMTGAGFGGCAVALVAADRSDDVMADLRNAYRAATSIDADVFVTRAAPGPVVHPL